MSRSCIIIKTLVIRRMKIIDEIVLPKRIPKGKGRFLCLRTHTICFSKEAVENMGIKPGDRIGFFVDDGGNLYVLPHFPTGFKTSRSKCPIIIHHKKLRDYLVSLIDPKKITPGATSIRMIISPVAEELEQGKAYAVITSGCESFESLVRPNST